jgi:hypothetical protein
MQLIIFKYYAILHKGLDHLQIFVLKGVLKPILMDTEEQLFIFSYEQVYKKCQCKN